MTSKKPHTKSRLGCKQCKRKRVKCDERPPCCGNCTQKGLECDFQEYAAVFDNLRVLTPTTFGNGGSPDDSAVGANIDKHAVKGHLSLYSFTLQDLGLLHHFTLHTAPTMGAIESELYCHVWRQEVPRLAQSHAFLMHAVLGFAAAHQVADSDIDLNLRDYSYVRHHYSRALSLFRESVDVIDQERAEALLCFTILTGFLTLYLECGTPAGAGRSDPIAGMVTFLNVVQNSTRVLDQVHGALRSSTIGVLLSHTWDQQPHALDPATEYSLYTLDCLSCDYIASVSPPNSNSTSNISSILPDALTKLRQLLALTDPKEKGWAFILLWPNKLDHEFVDLLQEGNPIALCALAHWCVPVYHAPAKWFTGDWAERMLRAIEQRLRGTRWEEGIRWPLRETIGSIDNGAPGSLMECGSFG